MGLGKSNACCTRSRSNDLSTQRRFTRGLHTTTTSQTYYFCQYCVSPNGEEIAEQLKLPAYQTHKPELFGRQQGRCKTCEYEFHYRNLSVDHITARSKGGSERKHIRTQKITHYTQYGITSLPLGQASAERLLRLRRGHWRIEKLSHRTRDVLLGEDASQVRCGNIPHVMAALRNTVLTLLRICGYTHIAKAFRFFAAPLTEALKTIQKTQTDN